MVRKGVWVGSPFVEIKEQIVLSAVGKFDAPSNMVMKDDVRIVQTFYRQSETLDRLQS